MTDERPKPPVAGVIYGEIAYWMTIVGMIIAIAGTVIYLTGTGFVHKSCLLEELWAGASPDEIWEKCAGVETPHGHWYLDKLSTGDGIAMAGIALACLAAVLGMWGTFIGMVLQRGKGLYIVFALILAIILTLSAAGILTLKH